ncbi:MAG: hypothetical protein DCF22_22060 [Leptolyngbya sp.]|nr:MAG: hypothetical protein DCF22_22060 [Leptolyngbya sp.]
MQLKMSVTVISAIALLLLSACSSGNQTANTSSPATSPSPAISPSASGGEAMSTSSKSDHSEGAPQGGQVVEVGNYHLQFVPEKEANTAHLDFYLLKGDQHKAVPNAKVTAQVQLPDGSQKSLAMIYDPAEKHYTAKLPNAAPGPYKVVILSDVDGSKVNGRFSFTQ